MKRPPNLPNTNYSQKVTSYHIVGIFNIRGVGGFNIREEGIRGYYATQIKVL